MTINSSDETKSDKCGILAGMGLAFFCALLSSLNGVIVHKGSVGFKT